MLTAEAETLVTENIKLTHHVAKRYYHPYLDHDDLASIGTIGLVKAAKVFDKGRGCEFSTLACMAIESEIKKEIRKLYANKNNGVTISIETPVVEGITLADILADNRNFERELVNHYGLVEALSQLKPSEQYVIVRYFGLFGNAPSSQQEIADFLGCSQVQVSRILRKSIAKLKNIMEGELK